MTTLTRERDVPWAPAPNELTLLAGDHRAAGWPVTAVAVLVRDDTGRVLLTRVDARGWDLPGGHVEDGEDLACAARRELVEETGLALPTSVTPRVAGTLHLHVAGPVPAGYRYPHPDSAQLLLEVSLDVPGGPVAPAPGMECSQAAWVPVAQVPALTGPRVWHPLLGAPTR